MSLEAYHFWTSHLHCSIILLHALKYNCFAAVRTILLLKSDSFLLFLSLEFKKNNFSELIGNNLFLALNINNSILKWTKSPNVEVFDWNITFIWKSHDLWWVLIIFALLSMWSGAKRSDRSQMWLGVCVHGGGVFWCRETFQEVQKVRLVELQGLQRVCTG